jgi:hypothetical protein
MGARLQKGTAPPLSTCCSRLRIGPCWPVSGGSVKEEPAPRPVEAWISPDME